MDDEARHGSVGTAIPEGFELVSLQRGRENDLSKSELGSSAGAASYAITGADTSYTTYSAGTGSGLGPPSLARRSLLSLHRHAAKGGHKKTHKPGAKHRKRTHRRGDRDYGNETQAAFYPSLGNSGERGSQVGMQGHELYDVRTINPNPRPAEPAGQDGGANYVNYVIPTAAAGGGGGGDRAPGAARQRSRVTVRTKPSVTLELDRPRYVEIVPRGGGRWVAAL